MDEVEGIEWHIIATESLQVVVILIIADSCIHTRKGGGDGRLVLIDGG